MTVKRKATWETDEQFNYGSPTKKNVEIIGTGESAYVTLVDQGQDEENIPFTDPSNYDYDSSKIEINNGMATLKGTGQVGDFPFDNSANYSFNSNKIEISAGTAKLKETGDFDGLVGYWKFEDNFEDSSGNENHGTNHGAIFVDGKVGRALDFDTGTYVSIPPSDSLKITDEITIEVWVKSEEDADGSKVVRILIKDQSYGFQWDSTGEEWQSTIILKLSGSWVGVSNPVNLVKDTWYHLVGTYDGQTMKIYVNGELKNSKNITSSIETNDNYVFIGSQAESYQFKGIIDEVAIYNRALSAEEIQDHYNSGLGRHLSAFPQDDPEIVNNTGFSFSAPIVNFFETSVKPDGTEIKYQVSSDDGSTWKWWDGNDWKEITAGKTNSWYFENEANSASEINQHIDTLANAGTFKFKAFLHTSVENTPLLDHIKVNAVTYPVGNWSVIPNFDLHPNYVKSWESVEESVEKPEDTDIKYQYSTDSGQTWNGTWLTKTELENALQGISCSADGSDKLRIKFQLSTSSSTKTPKIDNLKITYHKGYATSGEYTSYAYTPSKCPYGIFVDSLEFETEEPSGTTITVEARFTNNVLEQDWTEYDNGDKIGKSGTFIQFKAKLATSNVTKTPKLKKVEFTFGDVLVAIFDCIYEDVNLIKKIETGRWKIENDYLIVYDEDGVTPLKKFLLKGEQKRAYSERVPVS